MGNRYRHRAGGRVKRSSSFPSRKRARKALPENSATPRAVTPPTEEQGGSSSKTT
ncbi:hypothetical protein [Streptomyces qinglanensis]|uniref:hypothetical protein n=1 Tax=Streptomyces qinglanensis TaxID=943816 RepID=UPI003D744D1B